MAARMIQRDKIVGKYDRRAKIPVSLYPVESECLTLFVISHMQNSDSSRGSPYVMCNQRCQMTRSLSRKVQTGPVSLCASLGCPAGVSMHLCSQHLDHKALAAQEKGVQHLWGMAAQLLMAGKGSDADLVTLLRLQSSWQACVPYELQGSPGQSVYPEDAVSQPTAALSIQLAGYRQRRSIGRGWWATVPQHTCRARVISCCTSSRMRHPSCRS